MTTAFSGTVYQGPVNFGVGMAYLTGSVQMPSTSASGGSAWDLTSYFSTVQMFIASVGAGKEDHAALISYVGTANTTEGGITISSGSKVCPYWGKSTSDGPFADPSTGDLSSIDTLKVFIVGHAA
jgi:hypothetical protein